MLRRVEPTGSVERIRTRQAAVLVDLLLDSKLSRLVEHEAFATRAAPAYTIADLFGDLHRGISSEVTVARPNVDAYRRNVQRTYANRVTRAHFQDLRARIDLIFNPTR